MPILDAVKERIEPALDTVKQRVARGTVRVAQADLTADRVLSGLVDGVREWLAPRFRAAGEHLAPKVAAARERMAPVAEAAKERLAPVVEPLAPVFDRVKEAATGFGEIAVGSVPDAEEVADPVGELRAFFDIQATAEIEPLAAPALEAAGAGDAMHADGAPSAPADEEPLEVPAYRPWALSTLEEEPEPAPVLMSRRSARLQDPAAQH